jgi:hypothetical protein
MTVHGLSCIQVEVVFVRSKYKQHIPGALYSAYFESCSLKSKVNTSPSESEDERKTYMIVSIGHRLDGLIVIIIGLGLGLCGYLCGGGILTAIAVIEALNSLARGTRIELGIVSSGLAFDTSAGRDA